MSFGEVGDLVALDAAPIEALLGRGIVPVLCPPAGDGRGGFLNVNADVLAARVAVALGAAKLVFLTGAPGILRDPADRASLAFTLSLNDLGELEARGALEKGMRVKTAAIREALSGGVERVHVVSGLEPQALLVELYTNHGSGTLVTTEPQQAPEEEWAAS